MLLYGQLFKVGFLKPVESGNHLVGLSLCGNPVRLGIAEGYVDNDKLHYSI